MPKINEVRFDKEHNLWVLDKQPPQLHNCRQCGKELDLNFYVCMEFDMALCKVCEKKSHQIPKRKKYKTGRLCPSVEVEHIHPLVKATVKVDMLGKALQ